MAPSNEQHTLHDKAEVFELAQTASDIIEQGNGAVLLDIGQAGKSEMGGTSLKLTMDGHVSNGIKPCA